MKMEGGVRSGGVLKKKSSSGCLIIKKKGGIEKDARLVPSSSSDEDESLEFMRRKVRDKRLSNGSMECKRNDIEDGEDDRVNLGIDVSGERKRSRFDLFEFDEYDEFDGKKMRSEYLEDRFKRVDRNDSGNLKELHIGSSNRDFAVNKHKQKQKQKQGSYLDGSSSGRSKGSVEEDEADMPISLLRLKYRESADESIRLQGKNGVLKVRVNKKKKMDFPSLHKNYDPKDLKERKGSRSNDVVKKDSLVRSPIYQASKTPKNRGLLVDKEEKEMKLENVKPLLNKGKKARDSEVETDTELKLTPPSLQGSSRKGITTKVERSPPPENSAPAVGKAKRGGSTEKQMLREKIRTMLIDAGWTIDYRPRRNRDYLDSVYISPSGTAYWSITKAYDAFKKQLREDNCESKLDVGSPSFEPISEDLINKLTRQTKKKMEEEMGRKRKHGMTKSANRSSTREAAESSDSEQNKEQLGGKSSESDDSPKKKSKKIRVEKSSTDSKPKILQGRISKVVGRCTLLVRGSDKGENSDSDGYVPYSGKRTVLAWLIDSGTAQLSEKVQYMNRRRTRAMLEGWITRDGIHCGCCSKILSVSKFELHAGSKLRQPFQNIYLESGSSLLQCQIDAWNSQEESARQDFHSIDVDGDDPDDDTCGVCGDGGDLICCDSCPSTFHQICLEIKMLPSGDWHCPNCTCKFCGYANANVAEGNDTAGNELNRCSFCEKKYHKSCSEKEHDLPTSSNGTSFCGLKCQELYDHFQKILGIKHELEAGFSWSLIQRTDVSDASHRGFPLRVECNSKLAVALSVMDECFLPIMDRKSGINIIHNVVYNCGSNFNRLNYRRFYTAILERGDEIISAASIRLHGDRLAEMPFIATREIYRRQGMCRRLLSAIETELRSLKVGELIIPTISEHMNTWTTVFDFHKLEDLHKKEMKFMNMLVFPGTDMLQKELVRQENSDGVKVSESTNNQPQLPVLVKKTDIKPSLEQNNRQESSDSGGCLESKSNEEDDALDSGSPPPALPSNAICESDNTAANDSCESNILLASKGPAVEVENEQNESDANLKSSPTPNERNNISDEDKTDSCVVDNACITEAPPTLVKKLDIDSSLEKNRQESSDSRGCLESKSNDEDDVICESDNTAAVTAAGVENKQNESHSNTKSSPTPAECDNISDKVNINSCVVDNACKTETPPTLEIIHDSSGETLIGESSKFADVEVNEGPSVKVSENAGPTKALSDSSTKVLPGSVLETSWHTARDSVSGIPSGENETPHEVDGKVASPISSCEVLAQSTAATENNIL